MNVFDIIGPIMIGPSSSHTAGAVRLGKYSRSILGSIPKEATIYLSGSFAKTYQGHGTDKAIIGGILGMDTDDENIPISMEMAEKLRLSFEFVPTDIDDAHPNTARIILLDENGRSICIQGASVGGGNIVINEINGTTVNISGQSDTLIITHDDVPGVVSDITHILKESHVNINGLSLCRNKKGGEAVITIQIDGDITPDVNKIILKQTHIIESIVIKAMK